MKYTGIVTTVLICLLGAAVPAYTQSKEHGEKNDHGDKKEQPKAQKGKSQQKQQQNAQKHEDKREQQNAKHEQQRARQDQHQQQQVVKHEVQRQQHGERLAESRQRELVQQQQLRLTQYRAHLDQQRNAYQSRIAQLQQQKRMAQYRFQQQYAERLRQQQLFLQTNHPDYDRDPYFYTAPTYRYMRGGQEYQINQSGADMLRLAVNNGYQEGFRAGQADRQDRWTSGYEDSFAYQDANYGYNGYYVNREDYNYYFRQGYSKGYDDGLYSRSQYGNYSNGRNSILGNILSGILGLQSLR